MSIDRGMDKEDVVHMYSGILLSHKKNEIMPLAATWMDLEIIKLNEVSQKEERYIPSDITYMWNLKYDTNDLIYETETGSQTYIRDLRLMGRWQRGRFGVWD